MAWIELPHTLGCLVCGRDNPLGLRLSLNVDPETGIVRVTYTPLPQHIGFSGIVHGGVVATILDEAMVWAATWRGQRFCVCGELSVRFRQRTEVARPVVIEAGVELARSRLIRITGTVRDVDGAILCQATGAYVPVDPAEHQRVIATLLDEPATAQAAAHLRSNSPTDSS